MRHPHLLGDQQHHVLQLLKALLQGLQLLGTCLGRGLAARVIVERLQNPDRILSNLMVSELDAAKTISSLTLFEAAGLASGTPVLNQLGRRCCQATVMIREPQQTKADSSSDRPSFPAVVLRVICRPGLMEADQQGGT